MLQTPFGLLETLAPSIFKAYDIRGIVDKTLTEPVIYAVGRVMGMKAVAENALPVVVGRDGRLSGPRFASALIAGLIDSGAEVVDIGEVPTPVVYFAANLLKSGSGIAITGSHNPSDYNGLKMMVAGHTLFGPGIQAIREAIEAGLSEPQQKGSVKAFDALTPYIDHIVKTTPMARRLRIGLDAGHGVAGPTAMRLFEALGMEIYPLYMTVDGTFPAHHPDPSRPENLNDLIDLVKREHLDIGLAFDGDGDRLGVVTPKGDVIFPDRQMMLFSEAMLETHPGCQVIYDVKCTRALVKWIADLGGQPTICATGHSFVKQALKATKAPLAGEMSGHLFFQDERSFGYDDGLYAGARLLEILTKKADIQAEFDKLPNPFNTPEVQIPMDEKACREAIRQLQACAKAGVAGATDVITLDGVRVEYEDGFWLVRASNTTPILVCRWEGTTKEALTDMKARLIAFFDHAMPSVDWAGKLP